MNNVNNLLHNAFMAMMKYYLAKHEFEKKIAPKPRKHRKMDDAYSSFLKGNWSGISKPRNNRVSNTFGTM